MRQGSLRVGWSSCAPPTPFPFIVFPRALCGAVQAAEAAAAEGSQGSLPLSIVRSFVRSPPTPQGGVEEELLHFEIVLRCFGRGLQCQASKAEGAAVEGKERKFV